VAYEYAYYLGIEKSLFPDLAFKEARVIGGGSTSNVWNQIKADVLNLDYVQLNREEYAVLGSAILAGYAVGVFDDLKATARRFVRPISRIEPRLSTHAFYQPLVQVYVSLFDTLRETYQELVRVPEPPQG
jgi:xylulokinase